MPQTHRLPRAVYRRRRIGVLGGALLLLGGGTYLPLTLLAPLEPVAAEIVAPDPVTVDVPELDWPSYGAAAVGPLDESTLLGRAGSPDPRPLASITKVVTALVVLDARPLAPGEAGPTVTMGRADVALYDDYLRRNGSVVPVASGWRFTQRELLELTLIESANNYASTLARWAFGSDAAFVDAAAEWVEAHGLSSLRIREPSGLDPGNVGSAADLVELGRIVLAEPVLAEIVSTASTTVPHVGRIDNTNTLLDGTVSGIKTGTLRASGSNLLFSAPWLVGDEWRTIVGVVLGGPDHAAVDRAVIDLITSADTVDQEVRLIAAGTELGEYRTAWGDAARVVAARDADVTVWRDTTFTVTVTADPVTVAEDGSRVGTIVYATETESIAIPLELSGAIGDPGAAWRLTHPELIFG